MQSGREPVRVRGIVNRRGGGGRWFCASTIWRLGRGLGLAVILWPAAGSAAPLRNNSSPHHAPALDPEYGVGNWIWAAETRDLQTVRFWRRIEIPLHESVALARLTITADDSYRLFLDGREIGLGASWPTLTKYDFPRLLTPGVHILAVRAFNDAGRAGLVAGLHVALDDRRTTIDVPTDQTWKIVPNDEKKWMTRRTADPHWAAATVEGPYVGGPWKFTKPAHIFIVPPIQPSTESFVQSTWFRILVLSLFGLLAVTCLWLLGRLAIYSQAQRIVQSERARIARDIHDDLTAGLTHLLLLGEVAQSELPAGSEARQRVGKVCDKARGLSRSMNEIIWMVNSQRDTFRDFVSYVCKYAGTFLQPTPIRCRFDIGDNLPDLTCDLGVRRNLFLAVKEALNNAARHSGATELILHIQCRRQEIIVAVEDNGKGFDPALADRERNGLANMRQRAAEAGGACRLITQPGAGCRVEFAAPIARSSRRGAHQWLQSWNRGAPAPPERHPSPCVAPAPVRSSHPTP